jgi:hypothetical protein
MEGRLLPLRGRVGFLNDRVEERLEEYSERFDVVIMGDGDVGFVNALLHQLIDDPPK